MCLRGVIRVSKRPHTSVLGSLYQYVKGCGDDRRENVLLQKVSALKLSFGCHSVIPVHKSRPFILLW